jgi:hypothetical protein
MGKLPGASQKGKQEKSPGKSIPIPPFAHPQGKSRRHHFGAVARRTRDSHATDRTISPPTMPELAAGPLAARPGRVTLSSMAKRKGDRPGRGTRLPQKEGPPGETPATTFQVRLPIELQGPLQELARRTFSSQKTILAQALIPVLRKAHLWTGPPEED